MAKAIKTIGVVVGAVALVATGIGAFAVAGSALATTAAAVGSYASIAAGALGVVSTLAFKPKISTAGSPQNFVTDPQSGIPYCIGRTATSGVRIFADTNSRPGYTKFDDLLWFGVLLSGGGEIEEIEAFAADSDIVTFNASTGMAAGKYTNYMAQKLWKGGAMASALALSFMGATAPGWTSEHKLSGMTHAQWCLRFNKEGDLYSASVPEPKWIGKWVRVYDPRLDSTYPGGSGTCRALDESTYIWSRNPGLHALTWCLGRWQNGKKTLGIGAPVANIRIADFVECANICEANGWWCGGTEYSTDSKWDILKRMLQAGGAIPTMPGAMIGCRVNAPRISIATITGGDLLDTLKIPATKSRRDRFNAVIPRYRSEAHEWEIISGSQITKSEFVAADGGIRLKEIDYPLVQAEYGIAGVDGDKQVGQLAAYDIANSREAGPISWTTGPKWLGLKTGDCVTLDVPEEGLDGQDVILTGVSRDPSTGKISFTAETETPEKHPWALGQSTTPPPAFSLTAPDLTPPTPDLADWTLAAGVSTDGLPYIRVTGGTDNPYADIAIVQYRADPDGDWLHYGQFAASSVDVTITGLDGGTDYAARIAYINGSTTGPWRELDAVTTPDNGLQALIADVQTTVDAKRTIFVQPDAPSAAESAENDWWQQTTADRSTVIATYRRVAGSGQLAIGGNRITIGGNPISLCWTPVEDQRIAAALTAAISAADLADGKAEVLTLYSESDPIPDGTGINDLLVWAYLKPVVVSYWSGSAWVDAATYGATAEQAITIDAMADDDVLARGEKSEAIRSYQALIDDWSALDTRAATISSASSARAAAAAAKSALDSYLGGLTPAWNDVATDTPISGSAFRTAFGGLATANVALRNAVSVGAPSGTNVGSTPATTVESGAQAGGNAANSDGSIKDGKVDTGSMVTDAVTNISTFSSVLDQNSYKVLDYPYPPGTSLARSVDLLQEFAIVKSRSDSVLDVYVEFDLKSDNDIIIRTACGMRGMIPQSSPGVTAIISDGSRMTYVSESRSFIFEGLPAGSYTIYGSAAVYSGLAGYPTGDGFQYAKISFIRVVEYKR